MQKNTRNFVIIAHIDHGKSTLADRFLELTGTVEKRKMQEQYLDTMDLERERGITIKMQPVRMSYKEFVLNLIDTPGHVDFSYEVSRALAAVEGAILLVDASKGVQAQTLAHLRVAKEQGLVIIPAINKIDLPHARIAEIEQEILDIFSDFDEVPDHIYHVSAKTGKGVEEILNAVVKGVPPPRGVIGGDLRALVFDSFYDSYKGVVAHARIFDGSVSANQTMYSLVSREESNIKEVSVFMPESTRVDKLSAGDIGLIATGLKDINLIKIGDTITLLQDKGKHLQVKPLHGYKEPVPVVFASIYPAGDSKYDDLLDALSQLNLNDSALTFEGEYSEALGRGWKCGFLGMLHLEIVLERLRREYNLNMVVTSPSVVYRVKKRKGEVVTIYTPSKFPDASEIDEIKEPWVELEIIVSSKYLGKILRLLRSIRSEQGDTTTLGKDTLRIHYNVPLGEIITDFYDNLKSVSQGYASLSYNIIGERPGDLVKMDILLAGEKIEALSTIVPRKLSEKKGRAIVEKIKKVLPGENFEVSIQAAIGGKIIARETRSAYRKDVIAGLYGGDYTRKRKQLEKQKKGKKRLREVGKVNLDTETFMKIFTP